MDWIGWIIGIAGLAYAIWTDWRWKKDRERMHSFLKGLKTGVSHLSGSQVETAAINDEMATLIPPEKSKISN